jgi:hydrogenase expression/formation protein HypD
MKYLDEYRDREAAEKYINLVKKMVSRPWTIMEICGGQTHAIVKYGLNHLLPDEVNFVHGPGCPVCVTPRELIDKAIAIAEQPDVIFTSFGDMMRVPGTHKDLLMAKSEGADVRMVYSPLDALKLARTHPGKEVVFFAVGFETTAPANAMAVYQAAKTGVNNFSILSSHVLVPPAMETILSSPENRVQGFLAAGHVCTVVGYEEYYSLADRYKVPIVVTGFEPLDILQGTYMVLKQLEEGRYEVENQYARVVQSKGNLPSQDIIKKVFQVTDRNWRGVGGIPKSGLELRPEYEAHDAEKKYDLDVGLTEGSPDCIAGEILRGIKKPMDCPVFGTKCTPEHPLGAPMVSSEGACAAYYHYGNYRQRSRQSRTPGQKELETE